MSLFAVVVPIHIEVMFAIINIACTGCCLVVRIHHQRKYPTKLKRILYLGLISIIFAFLLSLTLLNTVSFWFFGDVDRWCDLGLRISCLMYVLHRYFLYAFIVWRMEVMNRNKLISSWIMLLSKVLVIVLAIISIFCALFFTYGIEDENWPCNFEMDYLLLVFLFIIDMGMCLGASFMFIWPVYSILLKTNDPLLRKTMKKERLCMGITVSATILTLLTVGIVDGSGAVIGFDCSITSVCLVVLMAPVHGGGKRANTEWFFSPKSLKTGGLSNQIFMNSESNKDHKHLSFPFCCCEKQMELERPLEVFVEFKSSNQKDEEESDTSEFVIHPHQSSLILDAEIDILLSQATSEFLITPKELHDSPCSQLTVRSKVSQGIHVSSIDSESITPVEENKQRKTPTAIQLEFVNL